MRNVYAYNEHQIIVLYIISLTVCVCVSLTK